MSYAKLSSQLSWIASYLDFYDTLSANKYAENQERSNHVIMYILHSFTGIDVRSMTRREEKQSGVLNHIGANI